MGIPPSCRARRNAPCSTFVLGTWNELSRDGPGWGAGRPACGHPRGLKGGCRGASWSQKSIVPSGRLVTLQIYIYYESESWKSSWFLLMCSQTANYFLLSGGAKYINIWTPQLKRLGLPFSSGWISLKDDAIDRDPTQIRTKYCVGAPCGTAAALSTGRGPSGPVSSFRGARGRWFLRLSNGLDTQKSLGMWLVPHDNTFW